MSSGNNKDETKKNPTSLKTNQLHQLDEKELRDLLDEAYSYKKYSDRDSKSKIFKELLVKAELEDKERVSSTYNEIFTRKSQKKYSSGGSLQNLNDVVRFEYFHPTDKRSGYSKNKKSPVSVTTKEYGGGSLPCNFDNMLYSEKYDDLRTNPLKDKKPSSPIMHAEKTVEHMLGDSSKQKEECDSKLNCIVSQVTAKSDDQIANRRSSFYVSSADTVIDIPLLEMKNEVDDPKPLQLCSAYSSVKCIIDDKGITQPIPIVMSHIPKTPNTNFIGNVNQSAMKQFDENGNTVSSTNTTKTKSKIKVSKSDRNIKRTFKSTDIEGYRGEEEVETLVNYIESENQDKSKSKKKPNIPDDKLKKKINKKNKVKRYNSLEELRSTKEFVDDETQINTEKSYSSKNLDRYSWGKAEISFLQSSKASNPDSDISSSNNNKNINNNNNNNNNDIWSTYSMESLINDCSGFNLVTNKKKSRKKMQFCLYEKDPKTSYGEINKCTNPVKTKTQLHKKTSGTEKKIDKIIKGRRKSLSSVPQSESECSDVESVHSLPGYSKHHTLTAKSCLSYAEITRKSSRTQNVDNEKHEASIETTTTTNTIVHNNNNNNNNKKKKESIEQKGEDIKQETFTHESELQKALDNTKNTSELSTIRKHHLNNVCKTSEEMKKEKQKKVKSFVNKPAVIMKDCNASSVNELVFGFDIDKDLLCDDDVHPSRNKTYITSGLATKEIRSIDATNDSQKTKQIKSMKLLNCPTNRNSSDLENIVNFVSSAWEEIILGSNGNVEYYNSAFNLSA
ncbi:putative uncharacterized protein DDB_G0267840 [Culicoides brevitarsis]|uniref:putative uncharacterized protein DDB_G0267840 n=1 Tax=Culicoides brevitarsis TaxID=469753 RepID=UPI00307C37FB